MTTYSPLEDRLLVRVIKKTEPEKTESGIITDMGKKEVTEAEVYAIGIGRYATETGVFMPTALHKGDTVLVGIKSGMPIDIPLEDGTKVEMKLMRESDVLALIKKKEISS